MTTAARTHTVAQTATAIAAQLQLSRAALPGFRLSGLYNALQEEELLDIFLQYANARRGAAELNVPEDSNATSYMDQLLATPVTYHEHIIEALKDFKRYHKLGNESDALRLEGMRALLNEVASNNGTVVPSLRMGNMDSGDSGTSYYDHDAHEIVMQGKLSIITFLHEIGHAVYGYDEHMARVWSINLFKKVYPKAFARLEVHDGFVLRMRDDRVQAPVIAAGPEGGAA
jgi:hypothetical protein